jgi:glyoxylase-like metal-dependent hydrolase (beta-lactamase superfamily II)
LKIGNYDVHAVDTGTFALDGGAMFGVIPWVFWSKTNPPDERNRVKMATRCLLIRGNGRIILVDNGNGDKWNAKLRDIYKIDTSEHDLHSSLKRLGVAFQDVTDVILTHLHFDHAGGSTTLADGHLEPTFPNATYYVQKKHWELSQCPSERDRASFRPEDYQLLMERKILKLLDGECELFPGVEVLVTNGHTAAQQHPKISDGTTTLFYCADLVPFISQVPYPYILGYDVRPLETLGEKKRIFPRAYEERWILFLEHDPDTQAIMLKQTEKGFAADPHPAID